MRHDKGTRSGGKGTTRRRPLRRLRLDLHPFAVLGIGVGCLALLAWSAATTSYALFRDDVLIEIRQRHSASERASGDEIAALKTEIGRLTTKHMVEREAFGGRIDALIRRQMEFAERQEALEDLAGAIPGDGGKQPPRFEKPIGSELRLNRPAPTDETGSLGVLDADTRLAVAERGLDRLAKSQKAALSAIEQKLQAREHRLAEVHLAAGVPAMPPVKAAMGGPFIPLPGLKADSFTVRMAKVQERAQAIAAMRRTADSLPLRHPAPGAARTSGFGGRADPFFHAMAFHSGMDFALPEGAPVRATGAGRVVQAGWNGGYGNMVEIDHGLGLTTRYAHLSAVMVDEGQQVKPNQTLGLAGSTGRSTGSHLHYETRRNGSAVDPARFIAAGRLLD